MIRTGRESKASMGVHGATGGRNNLLDSDGFLQCPLQWTEEMAEVLGGQIGLPALNPDHWKVIRFVRGFYTEYGRSPSYPEIRQITGITRTKLDTLFPGGFRYGVRRLAGLPNPKGWL